LVNTDHSVALERAPSADKTRITLRLFPDRPNDAGDARRHVQDVALAETRLQDASMRVQRVQVAVESGQSEPQSLGQVESGVNSFLLEAGRDVVTAATSDAVEFQFQSKLTYPSGKTRILQSRLPITLKAFSQFYDRYEVQYQNSNVGDMRMDPGTTSLADWKKGGSASVHGSPAFEANDYFLFVHGWNMDDDDKRMFGETAFKRLYWQGFHGTFGMFNWPTFKDPVNIGLLPGDVDATSALLSTFNASEFTAYRSAATLLDVVQKLDVIHGRPSVMAHSMGNFVVAEAMRLWAQNRAVQPLFKEYLASHSAIPGGAFGEGAYQIPGLFGSNDYYFDYPGMMLEHEVANRSHAFFAGIGHAAKGWTNIHNSDDYALNIWHLNNVLAKYAGLQNHLNFFWPYEYDINEPLTASQAYRKHQPYRIDGNTRTAIYAAPGNRSALGLGANGYETLAFLAVSDTEPMGKHPLITHTSVPWSNVDLHQLGFSTQMPGGTARPNHSFEFHYDIFATCGFWQEVLVRLRTPR